MSVHPLGGSRLPNAARPRAVGIVMRDTEATGTGVVGSLVVGMSVARAVTTRIAVVTSVASGGGIGTRVAGRTGIGAAIVASPDARPDAGRIAAVATTTTAATTADTATTGDTAAVVGIVMRDTEATGTGVVGSLVVGMSVARAVTTRIAVVTSVASGGGIGTRVAGRTGIGAAIVASPDARPDAGRIAAVATTTTAATTADTATTGDTAAVVGIVMRDTEATETGEAALRDVTPWSPNRCRPETSTQNPDAGSPA